MYANRFSCKLDDIKIKGLREFILETLSIDFIKKEKSIKSFDISYNMIFIYYDKYSVSFHYKDFSEL